MKISIISGYYIIQLFTFFFPTFPLPCLTIEHKHTMKIAHQKVVTIEYTLRDEEGTVLDSSKERKPLAYIHGMGNLIPGLETHLNGKSAGDTLNVSIPPADGYGEHDALQVIQVSRKQFEGIEKLEVGMQFVTSTPDGQQVVTVSKIEDDKITVDGNHPLAGKTLNFDVKVIEVRDATEDELSHGHVHGPGGHHH